MRLLRRVRAGLNPGDGLLLGVDLVKDEMTLLAAYDDVAGVTADFNLNLLARLNRELAADFDLDSFAAPGGLECSPIADRNAPGEPHRAEVRLPALDWKWNSPEANPSTRRTATSIGPGQAEAMIAEAGFATAATWTDKRGWFSVCLGLAE